MRLLSGIVKEVNKYTRAGIIEDSLGKEFYFHISECMDCELPEVGVFVSFMKDPDFKTTNVALLIKPVGQKVA